MQEQSTLQGNKVRGSHEKARGVEPPAHAGLIARGGALTDHLEIHFWLSTPSAAAATS